MRDDNLIKNLHAVERGVRAINDVNKNARLQTTLWTIGENARRVEHLDTDELRALIEDQCRYLLDCDNRMLPETWHRIGGYCAALLIRQAEEGAAA